MTARPARPGLWITTSVHKAGRWQRAHVGGSMHSRQDMVEEVLMESVNEVRLVGRLSGEPVERLLPSGDSLVVSRVVVDRDPGIRPRSRQRADVIDCAGWTARVQRSMRGWRSGDVVEVQGAVRRRFYRAGGQTAARVEVEVSSARVVRRAAAG